MAVSTANRLVSYRAGAKIRTADAGLHRRFRGERDDRRGLPAMKIGPIAA